jgi:Zn-dependent peptidase ImmA (M78 family)/transcriptional regulator with XRE-family HTH domain
VTAPRDEDPNALLAQTVSRAFDPGRLLQARRLAGLSMTDTARAAGVSPAAVGQYERGEITPRPETALALARALKVPVGHFALGRPRAHVDITQASFRHLRSTTIAQQQQACAFVEQVWELSTRLEAYVEFPDLDLPDWAINSEHAPDPRTAAQAIRTHWDLGFGPINFLVYELEQHGILTVLLSLRGDADTPARIDAFSTPALPRPLIVLTPDRADDVLRHRFTAAHELGHLLLHRNVRTGTTAHEREADAFAAELLMPAVAIAPLLPRRVQLHRLEELSQQWGVSTRALVFRSKELELISEATARRAYITLNSLTASGALRPRSIADYPGEQPELLRNALELLEGAGQPIAEIAADLQMSTRQVRNLAGVREPPTRLTLVREPPPERP